MSNMKRKPIVGETLYDRNIGNAVRYSPSTLIPVTVESVGRKYFTCVNERNVKTSYHLDTWRQNTEYCEDHKLYETEQEWLDEKERYEILDTIREEFSHYRRSELPLVTLRKIKAALDEHYQE